MGDLSNHVIFNKASSRLRQIKLNRSDLFENGNVILYLHRLMNNVLYSAIAYKFIFSLFDLELDILNLETNLINKIDTIHTKSVYKRKVDPDVDDMLLKRPFKGDYKVE